MAGSSACSRPTTLLGVHVDHVRGEGVEAGTRGPVGPQKAPKQIQPSPVRKCRSGSASHTWFGAVAGEVPSQPVRGRSDRSCRLSVVAAPVARDRRQPAQCPARPNQPGGYGVVPICRPRQPAKPQRGCVVRHRHPRFPVWRGPADLPFSRARFSTLRPALLACSAKRSNPLAEIPSTAQMVQTRNGPEVTMLIPRTRSSYQLPGRRLSCNRREGVAAPKMSRPFF